MSQQQSPVGAAIVIRLTKPVTGHQGQINQIALKQPTFGDYVECGDIKSIVVVPATDDQRGEVRTDINPRALANWFQRLSGLPMSICTQFSYGDGQTIYAAIQTLLAPAGDPDLGNGAPAPGNSSSSAGLMPPPS